MGNSKKTAAAEVRVVLIEYHHIQTDASNFKSVVQSLTGKHSSAMEGGGGSESCRKRQRVVTENNESSVININFNDGLRFDETHKIIPTTSFKDLDRLLTIELPSIEDLNWMWTD